MNNKKNNQQQGFNSQNYGYGMPQQQNNQQEFPQSFINPQWPVSILVLVYARLSTNRSLLRFNKIMVLNKITALSRPSTILSMEFRSHWLKIFNHHFLPLHQTREISSSKTPTEIEEGRIDKTLETAGIIIRTTIAAITISNSSSSTTKIHKE